ncbi:RanBP-type and C3HC4-type zinc finger-containing protein 1 [Durusdinium trenchii]|uniref:RanBP-type and C3HC4-type zinc finger-containing protein 1 n=1 Tax=Durusdinium trenchii TaxID=1381693 RepID=A0ABP0IAQ4_9DINO
MKGPSKGPGGKGRGYTKPEETLEILDAFGIARQCLCKSGVYRLLAHGGAGESVAREERRGTYHFDVSTGKLTEADETMGYFSAEHLEIETPLMLERAADAHLPVVSIMSSEVMVEIQKPEHAGAFIVIPSQFNGVEFPSHCSVVESVEEYKYDHTGGPCAQLAVHPGIAQFLLDNAATDRRFGGLDATRELVRMVNSSLEEHGLRSKKQMFQVLNGYLKMPVPDSDAVASLVLSALQQHLSELRLPCTRSAVACGLQPCKTKFSGETHRVNLVYASAVPVNAYVNGIGAVQKGFGDEQLHSFQRSLAELFLVAQYLGALQLAAKDAVAKEQQSKGSKSKVLLMPLGGGVFKNSWESIVKSIALAVELCKDLELLDIHVLVLAGGRAGKGNDTPADERVKELLQKHRKLRVNCDGPDEKQLLDALGEMSLVSDWKDTYE